MIKIGDRVNYLLANPPLPGDLRGLLGRGNGRSAPILVYADIIAVNADDTLNLIVSTVLGTFIANSVSRDESRTIPDTWSSLVDLPYQPALFNRRVSDYSPGNGAAIGVVAGMTLTSAGTISHPTLATTNAQTSMRRTRFASATTANAVGGIFSAHAVSWRGNARNLGGFFLCVRFTQATNVNASRAFIGLSAATSSVVAAEPSAANNSIGFGYNTTDLSIGNWQLITRDAATTQKIDIVNAPRNTTSVYDAYIIAPPGETYITAKLYNAVNGLELFSQVITTNLPSNTTFLRLHAALGAAATVTATQFELAQFYLESNI